MKKFRLIFGIILGKILLFAGKLLGRKSSAAPGNLALRICPDLVKLLAKQVQYETICVLGTNGKTTTTNMIYTLLSDRGFCVVCNTIGANMFVGVATAYLAKASITGKLKADYAVLEIDEAHAKIIFDHLTPDIIVVTNLFRDQMDRYGELEQTLHQIRLAVDKAPKALLCLNGDDPMACSLKESTPNAAVTFGVSEQVEQPFMETPEGRKCPLCGEALAYRFYHYNQLGDYSCPHCGFQRPQPDYAATNVECKPAIRFTLNQKETVSTDMIGFYNCYNMLAAIAVTSLLEVGISNYSDAFSRYENQTARMETFALEKSVVLNLVKNPAGLNQAIAALLNDPRKKAVVVGINDMPSDGIDISWLYDVDFEALKHCTAYGAAGKRCHDVALRLYYADVCDAPQIDQNPVNLAKAFLQTDCEVIYLLVNYTLIFDAKDALKKMEAAYRKQIKTKKGGSL